LLEIAAATRAHLRREERNDRTHAAPASSLMISAVFDSEDFIFISIE
jgi:hypothetical protein